MSAQEPSTPPISVVVMTKNEEANIGRCLRALQRFPEVFVVDSGSEDETVAIASRLGASVVDFHWNGRYPKKKEWCLRNLPFTYEWALFVDADEIVTDAFIAECNTKVRYDSDIKGYFVRFDQVFLGRRLRYGFKTEKLILSRIAATHYPNMNDDEVHTMWEVEGHYQPVIRGKRGRLSCAVVHHDYKSLYDYFARHNRYSDWEASLRLRAGGIRSDQGSTAFRQPLVSVFDRLPLKPLLIFLYGYVAKFGFLDGLAGFHYALFRSYYYWQIRLKQLEPRSDRSLGSSSDA